MWKIGNLPIEGPVILAPMSGYTSEAYREFMRPFGISLSFTEMISSKGLIFNDGETESYVSYRHTHPTGLQLFGNEPDEIAKAAVMALRINSGIDLIDVNMGCPVEKITRSGSGSALMKDPAKCGEIIRKLKKAVDVPVTAKIRLGWSEHDMNFMEVIEELSSAGADAITVHARTKKEKYAGSPHYDEIENLREEISVPLMVSGNIYSVESAVHAMEATGADAVMVARGGVGNPFLVTQISEYFRTGRIPNNPLVSQQIDWCLEFSKMIMDEKGTEAGIRKLRTFAPKFISRCRGCRVYRKRIATTLDSFETLESILDEIRCKMGSKRTYTPKESGFDYDL